MKPVIYQVFTRLYGNQCQTCVNNGTIEENGCGKMNDFTPSVLQHFQQMGVSHVWFTGIIRHASQTDYTAHGIPRQHAAVVKGRAGSPYAIADYYDVDPDLAVDVDHRMDEFQQLVARTHHAGMKVVIDFVPNHVARQYHSVCQPQGTTQLGAEDDTSKHFSQQNNFYYLCGQPFSPYFDLYHGETEPYAECPAKATGNDCFTNAPGRNDWYETVKLNYGVDYTGDHSGHFDPVPSTWHKMLDILRFWAGKQVDAFRCDMAEMVPVEFWAWATSQLKADYPHLQFIGEVYNPADYRRYLAAGFDWLYDKVGMYDALRDVVCHRRPAEIISWAWQQTDDIASHMLYFLENHDEQRLASDFFAGNGRHGLPALAVALLLRGNPFMLYAGQEYGEPGMDEEGFSGRDGRTTIFDYWSVSTLRRALTQQLTDDEQALCADYSALLSIATAEEAVADGLMFDLMYVNRHLQRQFAFLRKSGSELLVVVANFDHHATDVDLNLPEHAFNYLSIAEGDYQAKELLTKKQQTFSLKADGQLHMQLPADGTVVYKIPL